jgi:hypothetical protein
VDEAGDQVVGSQSDGVGGGNGGKDESEFHVILI